MTCGVPQGSAVGPLLWNLAYGRVLRLELPTCCNIIGFSDNILLVTSAKTIRELENKANAALNVVSTEIKELGLELAVVFTNKRKYTNSSLKLDGHDLELKDEMRYLRMIVEKSLLFKSHTKVAAIKAEKAVSELGRLMPNIGGPETKTSW